MIQVENIFAIVTSFLLVFFSIYCGIVSLNKKGEISIKNSTSNNLSTPELIEKLKEDTNPTAIKFAVIIIYSLLSSFLVTSCQITSYFALRITAVNIIFIYFLIDTMLFVINKSEKEEEHLLKGDDDEKSRT